MHETLLLLERLYALDRQRDETWDAIKQMERELAATEARLVETDAELVELDKLREQARATEREVVEGLDKYVARRDQTRKQLDVGAIPDFLAAERQLNNYVEIIDGLETDLLERMERRETLDRKLMAVNDRKNRLVLRRGKQRARLEVEGTAQRAHLDELNQQRKADKASVPTHILREYDQLRRLHRDALAWLEGGACQACRMVHPPQIVLEVRRGSRVHRCRGCTRFLAGIAQAAPADDADEVTGSASRVDG